MARRELSELASCERDLRIDLITVQLGERQEVPGYSNVVEKR
jgi:hypothetical protein